MHYAFPSPGWRYLFYRVIFKCLFPKAEYNSTRGWLLFKVHTLHTSCIHHMSIDKRVICSSNHIQQLHQHHGNKSRIPATTFADLLTLSLLFLSSWCGEKYIRQVTCNTQLFLVGGFSPPLWKICASQIGSFPQGSGWKFQKYLSCHHLVLDHLYTKPKGSLSQVPSLTTCTCCPSSPAKWGSHWAAWSQNEWWNWTLPNKESEIEQLKS